eukprot:9681703-Alexandrium_andersonii.AAC.1
MPGPAGALGPAPAAQPIRGRLCAPGRAQRGAPRGKPRERLPSAGGRGAGQAANRPGAPVAGRSPGGPRSRPQGPDAGTGRRGRAERRAVPPGPGGGRNRQDDVFARHRGAPSRAWPARGHYC